MKTIKENILTGRTAKKTVQAILNGWKHTQKSYPPPFVSGYFKEGKRFTAFDNSNGQCFVEQFETKNLALAYCEMEFLISPDEDKENLNG